MTPSMDAYKEPEDYFKPFAFLIAADDAVCGPSSETETAREERGTEKGSIVVAE